MKEFDLAARAVRQKKNLSNETLLKLYALYKQGTIGDINTSCPSALDLRRRAMWQAWNERRGMAAKDAQVAYIELVRSL